MPTNLEFQRDTVKGGLYLWTEKYQDREHFCTTTASHTTVNWMGQLYWQRKGELCTLEMLSISLWGIFV